MHISLKDLILNPTKRLGFLFQPTFREYRHACVSTSSIETTFSAAAARNLPSRGWNLICAVPP